MDIRKSLERDLFGNLIEEQQERDSPFKQKSDEVIVLRGTMPDVPSRPYTVHRISPTEVWIVHE